jgi:hypothetical protein
MGAGEGPKADIFRIFSARGRLHSPDCNSYMVDLIGVGGEKRPAFVQAAYGNRCRTSSPPDSPEEPAGLRFRKLIERECILRLPGAVKEIAVEPVAGARRRDTVYGGALNAMHMEYGARIALLGDYAVYGTPPPLSVAHRLSLECMVSVYALGHPSRCIGRLAIREVRTRELRSAQPVDNKSKS